MGYYFAPPVVYSVPTSLSDPREARRQGVNASTNRLFSHFSPRARGRTVIRVAGVYQTVDFPSQALLDTASEVYLGGHVFEVTDTVAAALTAAGYTLYEGSPGATVHGEALIPVGFNDPRVADTPLDTYGAGLYGSGLYGD